MSGLAAWLVEHVRALSSSAPYRVPTEAQRATATAALTSVLTAVLAGSAQDGRVADGITVRAGMDVRPYTLLTSEPGWGVVVLDGDEPRQVVQVPHPGADRFTARIGLELFRAAPGSVLLVAGTHRRAGAGAADVAHRADSVFHAFAQVLTAPAVQLHGFAASSLPHVDAVVSPGAGTLREAHAAVANTLARRGLLVRTGSTGPLTGRTNVQGIDAAARGIPFLHLELAPALRADATGRAAVVDTLAATWP